MNISTALLVRYDLAHRYVVSPAAVGLLRERYLQLGGVRDVGIVDTIGQQFLTLVGEPQRAVAIQGAALEPGQLPQRDYRLGDLIGDELVVGMNIDGTDDGIAIVTPELVSRQQLAFAALERTIKRMAAGGTSASANPATAASPQGSGKDTTPPEFTMDPTVQAGFSPPWRAPRPFHWTWLAAELGVAGTSNTVIRVAKGAFAVGDPLVLGPGSTHAVVTIDTGFATGEVATIVVETAGAGAGKLTVTPYGATT